MADVDGFSAEGFSRKEALLVFGLAMSDTAYFGPEYVVEEVADGKLVGVSAFRLVDGDPVKCVWTKRGEIEGTNPPLPERDDFDFFAATEGDGNAMLMNLEVVFIADWLFDGWSPERAATFDLGMSASQYAVDLGGALADAFPNVGIKVAVAPPLEPGYIDPQFGCGADLPEPSEQARSLAREAMDKVKAAVTPFGVPRWAVASSTV